MADKIKITKDDIEAGTVEMPDGYKIAKYKTKDELDAELLVQINNLEAGLGTEPSTFELLDYAKLDHPYYQILEEIKRLRYGTQG